MPHLTDMPDGAATLNKNKMTVEQFIEKWKLQSGKGFGNAQFDMSKELSNDLEGVIATNTKGLKERIKELELIVNDLTNQKTNIRPNIEEYKDMMDELKK